MHKQEASILFKALGDETSVKMMKMLYNRGAMDFSTLSSVVGGSPLEFNNSLESLLDNELVLLNDEIYSANVELLDTLLKFIVTPCGCTH